MSDDVIDEAQAQAAAMVRLAVQIAEVKRWRDQRALAARQDALRAEQYRARATIEVARPYLAEGMRDRWWKEAHQDDAMHMLGVAYRFADRDPMAQQVVMRATREIKTRWDIDVEANNVEENDVEEPVDLDTVVEASDEELAAAEPRVEGEAPTPAGELRAQAVEHHADVEGQAAAIKAVEDNTTLPEHVKAGLLARLQPAAADDADAALAAAQADRDQAVADVQEFGARLQSGDETAESELARAEDTHAKTEDALTQARGRATTGDHEIDAGIQAREESFPVPADEATEGSARPKTRRQRRATRQARRARQMGGAAT